MAIYLYVRQDLVATHTPVPETGLETLSSEDKVRALDELKVLYPKQEINRVAHPKPERRVEKPFFQGDKEDYERLEKVQYLDERGNPVNLDGEGEP